MDGVEQEVNIEERIQQELGTSNKATLARAELYQDHRISIEPFLSFLSGVKNYVLSSYANAGIGENEAEDRFEQFLNEYNALPNIRLEKTTSDKSTNELITSNYEKAFRKIREFMFKHPDSPEEGRKLVDDFQEECIILYRIQENIFWRSSTIRCGEVISPEDWVIEKVESALGLRHRATEKRAKLYMNHRIRLSTYLETLQAVKNYIHKACELLEETEAKRLFLSFLDQFSPLQGFSVQDSIRPPPYEKITGFYEDTKRVCANAALTACHRENPEEYVLELQEICMSAHREKEDMLWRSGIARERKGTVISIFSKQRQASY